MVKPAISVNLRPLYSDGFRYLQDNKIREVKGEVAKIEKGIRAKLARKLWAYRKRVATNNNRVLETKREKLILSQHLQLEALYKKTLHSAHEDLITIIEKIAKQVIGEELKSNPNYLFNKLNSLLKQILDSRTILVTLHTSDVDKLYNRLSEENAGFEITLKTDDSIDIGNARITTSSGTITLSWMEHIDSVIQVMRANIPKVEFSARNQIDKVELEYE